jgi:hypothetical protein
MDQSAKSSVILHERVHVRDDHVLEHLWNSAAVSSQIAEVSAMLSGPHVVVCAFEVDLTGRTPSMVLFGRKIHLIFS